MTMKTAFKIHAENKSEYFQEEPELMLNTRIVTILKLANPHSNNPIV